ncbi:MAG: lytic transglycosylase domain-containing protein [bacterium]|nr:lytic transglycosylase domain-containing protein [bacterium]
MIKQNIKKVAVIMAFLFLMGLSGLSVALFQLNGKYEATSHVLDLLSGQMLRLEQRIDFNREKVADYDFMEYKTNALSRRYPIFSSILNTVYDKSEEYGFHPDLVLGVIKVESNYNPKAVSYAGAHGLMQVNLSVWRNELNIDTNRLYDVDYNIDLGLKILKRYYVESKGNLKRALHLYNNGYKYNNTSYTGKVESAVLSMRPNKISLQPPDAIGK